jgi:predicted N-acetyltransferase YhbS
MDPAAIRIRLIEPGELAAADELVRAAFESSVSFAPELRRYHAIEPEGMFVAVTREGLSGLAGAFDFGAFGYVGPMAVHPGRQKRGIGRVLLERVLTWLEACGTRLVLLDATDAGAPLYLAHGFRDAGQARLFARSEPREPTATSSAARPHLLAPGDLDAVAAFDATLFGAARPRALRVVFEEFPGRGFLTRDAHGAVTGYVCAGVKRIGPWAAQGRDEAEALLDAALALPYPDPPEVAVPVGNEQAPELLEARGFRVKFTVRHMQRGTGPRPGDCSRLLAQLSFATG